MSLEKKMMQFQSKMTVVNLFFAAVLLVFTRESFALSAKDIVKKSIDREDGKSSYSKSMMLSCTYKMLAGKKKCQSRPRKKTTEGVSLDIGKDEVSLLVVLTPASEKGMVFVQKSFDNADLDTQQSMYLPALKKIKRIVSESGSGPKTGTLFGSEFSYEDMEKRHVEDGTYKLLKEEVIDGVNCYVVESKPTQKRKPKTSYKRSISWISKSNFLVYKVELFDRKDVLKKTLVIKNYEKHSGIYIAGMMIMSNHQKRRMSMMRNLAYKINVKVEKDAFSERSLKDSAYRNKIIGRIQK
jgi:hypothetical protein